MPEWLPWLLLIPGGFFTLLFCVARFERRKTWPFVQPGSPEAANMSLGAAGALPQASQASDYVLAMGRGAEAAGFIHYGMLAHEKAPRIMIVAGVWRSADRRILLMSGSGTVIGNEQHHTALYTPLSDGRYLVTCDNNDEGDQSGLYRTKRLLNCPFDQLLTAHLKRMERESVLSHGFMHADGIESLREIYRRRTQHIIDRRRGHHLDEQGEFWRYNSLGALGCCLDFFPQLGNALFVQPWRVNRSPVASTALRPIGFSVEPIASAREPELKQG